VASRVRSRRGQWIRSDDDIERWSRKTRRKANSRRKTADGPPAQIKTDPVSKARKVRETRS